MTYIRTNWIDRDVQFPRQINLIKEDSTEEIVTYELRPGDVTSEGTPVNAVNLNNIEEGIVDIDEFLEEQIIYLESSGADDTATFQNALLETENKILVLDREGTYNISDTLEPLEGCIILGRNSTIINNINSQDELFLIVNSNITIIDLLVENTANNPGNLPAEPWYFSANFYINATSALIQNIKIINIRITNSIENSSGIIAMGEVENVKIKNCIIDGTGDGFGSCFHAEWLTGPLSPKNIIFENCTALNNISTTTNNSGFWVSAGSRIKLTNCRVYNCTRGFSVFTGDDGGQPNHIVNVSLENCHSIDIQNECSQVYTTGTAIDKRLLVSFNNCHFRGVDNTISLSAGSRIYQNEGLIEYTNCIFENVRRGIFFGESTGNPVTFKVSNCEFDDIHLQALYGWRSINSVIEHNKFRKINISGNVGADDSVVVLVEQSLNNIICNNIFGLDTSVSSRFNIYFVSDTANTTPTENNIHDNIFLHTLSGAVNIVNASSGLNYEIFNYIHSNIAHNGHPMTSGAVPFKNELSKKIAYSTAIPTGGSWRIGDYVYKTDVSVTGTPQYFIYGWARITTGTNNTLNTDWVEDRRFTGN